MRPPPMRLATTRNTCGRTSAPASHVALGGDRIEHVADLLAVGEEQNLRHARGGTTTNGWVTLYSSTGEGIADTLLATDPRSLDLFVYRRSGAAVG